MIMIENCLDFWGGRRGVWQARRQTEEKMEREIFEGEWGVEYINQETSKARRVVTEGGELRIASFNPVMGITYDRFSGELTMVKFGAVSLVRGYVQECGGDISGRGLRYLETATEEGKELLFYVVMGETAPYWQVELKKPDNEQGKVLAKGWMGEVNTGRDDPGYMWRGGLGEFGFDFVATIDEEEVRIAIDQGNEMFGFKVARRIFPEGIARTVGDGAEKMPTPKELDDFLISVSPSLILAG